MDVLIWWITLQNNVDSNLIIGTQIKFTVELECVVILKQHEIKLDLDET